MTKRKKRAEPAVHFDADGNPHIRLPTAFEDLGEITYVACGAMHVSEDPLIGTLTIMLGPYYVDVVITDEDAEEIIKELTNFLRGRSANLLASDEN